MPTQSPIKQVEARLYALADVRAKLAEDRAELAQLMDSGPARRPLSVARLLRRGTRLTEAQITTGLIRHYESAVAAGTREIFALTRALGHLEADKYFAVLPRHYVANVPLTEIAEELGVDISTVRRHRARLLRRLAVLLYGVEAVGA